MTYQEQQEIEKDCTNCKHKDEPYSVHNTEPGDVCFECIRSRDNWEPLVD